MSDRTIAISWAELLKGCQTGDESSWERTYATFRPVIISIARSWGIFDHAAEDIVQETFLKLCQSISKVKDYHAFSRFVRQTCCRILIDRNRSAHARKRGGKQDTKSLDELKDALNFDASTGLLDRDEGEAEMLSDLKQGLAEMEPPKSRLLILKYIECRSAKEICQITGIRAGTVDVQAHRYLKELKMIVVKNRV